jgi:hypothetical protein
MTLIGMSIGSKPFIFQYYRVRESSVPKLPLPSSGSLAIDM